MFVSLSGMTLEEKVGQMTEIGIDILGHFEGYGWVMDRKKLSTIFCYKVLKIKIIVVYLQPAKMCSGT